MKSWWLTVGFVFLVLCLDSGLEAAENRVVEIIYDFRKEQTDCRLQIRVDTILVYNNCSEDDCDKTKARIHQFEIQPTDNVTLIMKWQCDSTALCGSTAADIQYAVMGNAKNIDILKVLLVNLTELTMPTSKKPETSSGTKWFAVSQVDSKTCLQLMPVKDDLVAGGHLIVAFNKTKNQNGKDLASSGPWIFRIGTPPPRFTVSNGLVITNAAKPNEQESKFRDDDPEWRLVQAPFTFVNFRLGPVRQEEPWWIPYASVGFQLGRKPFDDLVLGLTLRRAEGSVGLNGTFGKVISRETKIRSNREVHISYDWGYAFGLSLDF